MKVYDVSMMNPKRTTRNNITIIAVRSAEIIFLII